MLTPRPVTLQRGALRLEPLMEADIPELVALAERNRAELVYMNGPLRPDWYRHAGRCARTGIATPWPSSVRGGRWCSACGWPTD